MRILGIRRNLKNSFSIHQNVINFTNFTNFTNFLTLAGQQVRLVGFDVFGVYSIDIINVSEQLIISDMKNKF